MQKNQDQSSFGSTPGSFTGRCAFTIYNPDGTPKKDSSGNWLPWVLAWFGSDTQNPTSNTDLKSVNVPFSSVVLVKSVSPTPPTPPTPPPGSTTTTTTTTTVEETTITVPPVPAD